MPHAASAPTQSAATTATARATCFAIELVHLTVVDKIECHTMIEKAGERVPHAEGAIMSDHLVIRLQIQESRHSQHCARHSQHCARHLSAACAKNMLFKLPLKTACRPGDRASYPPSTTERHVLQIQSRRASALHSPLVHEGTHHSSTKVEKEESALYRNTLNNGSDCLFKTLYAHKIALVLN